MLRKIVLYKAFEKAIIGNYPLLTKEIENGITDEIITNVEDLNTKKLFYYNNLNDFCVFKTNPNRQVIEVKGVD